MPEKSLTTLLGLWLIEQRPGLLAMEAGAVDDVVRALRENLGAQLGAVIVQAGPTRYVEQLERTMHGVNAVACATARGAIAQADRDEGRSHA